MFNLFKTSFKEFKSLKSVTVAAMLLALHTVLSLTLSIYVTESLKISVSFITNCITGYFFGPVVACVCAGLGDIIQYIIKPVGPYFFGWTLNAALAGLVYGMLFYNKAPKDITKSAADKGKLFKTAGAAVVAVIAVVWFVTDFAEAYTYNDAKEIIAVNGGNALSVIRQRLDGSEELANMFNMTVLSAVAAVLLCVLNFTRYNAAGAVISAISGLVMLLSAYTDRKTSDVFAGFVVIAVLFVVFAVIKTIAACKENNLDAGFIFRSMLAFAIVNLFVNAGLGTYWASVTYGKGFMVLFIPRLVKNIIQIPINAIFAYVVFNYVKRMRGIVKSGNAVVGSSNLNAGR